MPTTDPHRLAADARSILACPAAVSLVIDGGAEAVDDDTGLTDVRGTPTFLCRPGSPVTRAAATGLGAVLTVRSGLGSAGCAERADTLVLAGHLRRTGFEDCDCCAEVRDVVSLDVDLVVVEREGERRPVRVELFRSRVHDLNRGHLERSTEHANDCHQEELRQAIALGTGTRPSEVLGVRLAGLTPAGVEVRWVDTTGAHRDEVTFPRVARDLADLAELLRSSLHAGLC